MKSRKELLKVFSLAKGQNDYYNFDDFLKDAKCFIKDIKKRQVIMSMKVSRGGMTRHFNSLRYNMLLNICYNQKRSWDSVKVSGCGMDMHWHLLYRTCEDLLTKDEKDAFNSLSSGQPLL